MGDDEEHTELAEGSTIDAAVRMACQATAEGYDDDVKIEFEMAGATWRLRVELVGVAANGEGED